MSTCLTLVALVAVFGSTSAACSGAFERARTPQAERAVNKDAAKGGWTDIGNEDVFLLACESPRLLAAREAASKGEWTPPFKGDSNAVLHASDSLAFGCWSRAPGTKVIDRSEASPEVAARFARLVCKADPSPAMVESGRRCLVKLSRLTGDPRHAREASTIERELALVKTISGGIDDCRALTSSAPCLPRASREALERASTVEAFARRVLARAEVRPGGR